MPLMRKERGVFSFMASAGSGAATGAAAFGMAGARNGAGTGPSTTAPYTHAAQVSIYHLIAIRISSGDECHECKTELTIVH